MKYSYEFIEVMDAGIVIFVSCQHWSKLNFTILLEVDEKIKCWRLFKSSNEFVSILVLNGSNVISLRLLQFEKEDCPIHSIVDGIKIFLSDEQSRKAHSSIFITYDGIAISASEEQSLKALCPIKATDGGIDKRGGNSFCR